MGHVYVKGGGLVCELCGGPGAVERPCTYFVTEPGGQRLRYCKPDALCDACLARIGGPAKLHAACKEGARKSQAENDARSARLDAGELFVSCALSGRTWYVPAGQVGAHFTGRNGAQAWLLVPEGDYRREYAAKGLTLALSDFPGAVVWEDNPDVRKAREAGMTHVYVVAPVSVCPEQFEAFEVSGPGVIAVMAVALERLGHEHYSIQRKDAVPAPLFGRVAEDGRIQL
jgi:hypothetical protein